MIERAAAPLASVEENFAVDSTGFTACRFVRRYDVKYNRFTSEQQCVKAHLCCGVKTNVVTAIEIHGRDYGDARHLPAPVQTTAQSFTVKEVSADKGYRGQDTHNAIAGVGATPYIMFKANSTGGDRRPLREDVPLLQLQAGRVFGSLPPAVKRRIDRDGDQNEVRGRGAVQD